MRLPEVEHSQTCYRGIGDSGRASRGTKSFTMKTNRRMIPAGSGGVQACNVNAGRAGARGWHLFLKALIK